MISSISSATSYQGYQSVSRAASQATQRVTDRDGDNDNSKANEVEQKATQASGTIGTRIDTSA